MKRRQARSPAHAGFSILEMMFVATILIIVVSLVARLTKTGTEAANLAERNNQCVLLVQEAIDRMRSEARASVRVFANDAIGLAYRSKLAGLTGVASLAGSKLPTISVDGGFKKDDAANPKTGNELMLARQSWSADFKTTTGNTYRYDVYRIVRYFLRAQDGGPKSSWPAGLNLARLVSEPMVDGLQIDGITNATDRQQVLTHLLNGTADLQGNVHPKVQVVWKLGQDPAVSGTLRQILSTGTMVTTPQSPRPPTWTINLDGKASSNGILTGKRYSVASVYAPASYGCNKFGIATNAGSGFPHGFEVQVIGPSSARQIMVHLVVVGVGGSGQRAHAEGEAVIMARDQ